MVVPHRHIGSLADANPDELTELMALLRIAEIGVAGGVRAPRSQRRHQPGEGRRRRASPITCTFTSCRAGAGDTSFMTVDWRGARAARGSGADGRATRAGVRPAHNQRGWLAGRVRRQPLRTRAMNSPRVRPRQRWPARDGSADVLGSRPIVSAQKDGSPVVCDGFQRRGLDRAVDPAPLPLGVTHGRYGPSDGPACVGHRRRPRLLGVSCRVGPATAGRG